MRPVVGIFGSEMVGPQEDPGRSVARNRSVSGRIDELLGRAYQAMDQGDHETASQLARRVLSMDERNVDAEDLLAVPAGQGEIRRLTLMFADLIDSTDLSTRIEPEIYRAAVGRYKELVQSIVDRHQAHIVTIKGDGVLILFGHPVAQEDEVQRAVHAGLEICREVAELSSLVRDRFDFGLQVRVGVHRGIAYFDLEQEDVYGLAANMAARVSGLAPPDSVVVSAAVAALVQDAFELVELPAQVVKGIGDPVEHHKVLGPRSGPLRVDDGPLVGRVTEIDHLDALLREAMDGRLSVPGVALCGEAGIGKSRIAGTMVARAERAGALLLQLAGSAHHADVGLHAVRQLVEQHSGIGSASSPEERLTLLRDAVRTLDLDPSTHVPLLALVLGIAPRVGYEPVHADGARLLEQAVDAAARYVLHATLGRPTLILVEDLHWLDTDSASVLRRVLGDVSADRLVLMTSRERSAIPAVAGLQVLDLEPLSAAESHALITALHPSIDPSTADALRERCGGIPLYIDQLVAAVVEERAPEEGGVPDSLYEALLPRLRDRDARQVVEAAAAIGSAFDRELLSTVAGLDQALAAAAIDELIAGRVFEAQEPGTLRFRHQLVREVAAELAPPSKRRDLHAATADALVRGPAKDWRIIADHFAMADRFDDAALAFARMSSTAQRRGAIAEAHDYLTRGLELVERMSPGPARSHREVFLRLRRGFLSYAARGTASRAAAADFERCLQLREDELAPDILMTLTALYAYYVGRADLDNGLLILQTLEKGLGLGGPNKWPTLTAGFGMVEWYRGQFDAALAHLEEGVAGRAVVGAAVHAAWFMPNEPVASMHTHLAMARCIRGDIGGSEEQLAEARRRCEQVGFPEGPYSLSYSRQMETLMKIEAGALEDAAAVARALVIDAELHGFEQWADVGRAQEATVAALVAAQGPAPGGGGLDDHVARLTEIVERWRVEEWRAHLTSYDGALARVLLAAGRPDQALQRVEAGLQLARETTMHYYDAELLRLRAHARPDPHQCVADLRAAIELARSQGAPIFELRAASDLLEVLGEPARLDCDRAVEQFPDDSRWPELDRARALLQPGHQPT